MISKSTSGQTLILLLIFISVSIVIISGAVILNTTTASGSVTVQQGIIAKEIAESGIENALLLLLRNPNYSGETLAVGEGTAYISVTGDSINKTIQSTGQIGIFKRKIQTKITYTNNILSVVSWQDIQ